MVEEPLLPVLLLLSDIALSWLNVAQHGADSAIRFCRRPHKQRLIIDEHRPEADFARHYSLTVSLVIIIDARRKITTKTRF